MQEISTGVEILNRLSVEEQFEHIFDNNKAVRNILLRRLGISEGNYGLFINKVGRDGFVDRCVTLNTYCKLQRVVDDYFKYYYDTTTPEILDKQMKINENRLYKAINSEVGVALALRKIFNGDKSLKNIGTATEICNKDAFVDWNNLSTGWIMSVGFNDSKYFYTFLNLIADSKDYSLRDYILDKTGNLLLADMIDDIDPEKLELVPRNIIKVYSSVIGLSIWSILSPKYINEEQLIKTTEGLAIYRTSSKRSARSCKNICDAISETYKGVSISIYKKIPLDYREKVFYIHDIVSGDKFNKHNVQTDNQLNLIKYYRALTKEEIKNTDLIYESNGEIVRAYNKSEISFHNMFKTLNETNKLE